MKTWRSRSSTVLELAALAIAMPLLGQPWVKISTQPQGGTPAGDPKSSFGPHPVLLHHYPLPLHGSSKGCYNARLAFRGPSWVMLCLSWGSLGWKLAHSHRVGQQRAGGPKSSFGPHHVCFIFCFWLFFDIVYKNRTENHDFVLVSLNLLVLLWLWAKIWDNTDNTKWACEWVFELSFKYWFCWLIEFNLFNDYEREFKKPESVFLVWWVDV
jgi:hypothetical protein